jgi:hypothetical protein
MTDLTFLKPLVSSILRDEHREWTVQGFGFLRTYFGPADAPKKFRLNLWDSHFTVPNVSTIHDHPWDFKSVIVAGHFINQRYTMTMKLPLEEEAGDKLISAALRARGPTHTYGLITTGVGSDCTPVNVEHCRLVPREKEVYIPGDWYRQRADEIHETLFVDGAVTLNERVGDTEHARVFWPYGTEWVDAMPRPATPYEVASAVDYSLREWF